MEVKGKERESRALTADQLAQEEMWETLAGVLVEDLEYLSEDSYKNAARFMKKRLRAEVEECTDVYFDHCTVLFKGRTLSPGYRRKMQEEEAEARRRRAWEVTLQARGRPSSDSRAGTLVSPKRWSDATSVVAGSLL